MQGWKPRALLNCSIGCCNAVSLLASLPLKLCASKGGGGLSSGLAFCFWLGFGSHLEKKGVSICRLSLKCFQICFWNQCVLKLLVFQNVQYCAKKRGKQNGLACDFVDLFGLLIFPSSFSACFLEPVVFVDVV